MAGLISAHAVNSNSLPGPENITRLELVNGIVVLCRANPASASVVLSGSLPAGSLYDPDEKLGLAGFTASALMRGTQQRSFSEIYDILESAGASLGFSAGTHSASFSGRALAEDLDSLLMLLAEALQQPVFPEEYVERLRAQILTSLAIRDQDTAEVASLVFDQIVYCSHPYSRPEDGYTQTVRSIQRDDLVDFHRKTYGPRGLLLTIVGGIEPVQVLEKVRRFFENWQNPQQPEIPMLPEVTPLDQLTTQYTQVPGTSQSDIMIGAAGLRRNSPDFLAAMLGNNILGQFGTMGRIGEAVREKAGLAYYAGSGLSGGPGPGPWEVSAGVNPENVDRATELIIQEIRRFTSEPVKIEELEDTQANFIGRLPISLESNSGIASALYNLERFQLGLDYYLRYTDLVRSITREQILQVAGRYLDPGRLAVAVAGPAPFPVPGAGPAEMIQSGGSG
jgi:zinc protease